MNLIEDIPSLSIEQLDNGNLRLEGKSCPDGAIVDIHPIHLRLMAERLGLVREVSASDAELLTIERERAMKAEAALARLAGWLDVIDTRATQLHDNILGVSQAGHEDLNIEIAQSAALADIAEQVLNDARSALSRHVTPHHDESCQPGASALSADTDNTPKIGGVKDTRKRGAYASAQLELNC